MSEGFRTPRVGDQYKDELGPVTVMTTAKGYVMCRRPGAMPFVLSFEEWHQRYEQYRSEALHPSRALILKMLQERGPLSIMEICEHIGLRECAVRKNLYGLRGGVKKLAYVSGWTAPAGSGAHTPIWSAGDEKCKPMPKPLDKEEYQRRYRTKMRGAVRMRQSSANPFTQLTWGK